MERIVIVGYKPLPGKKEALIALSKSHWKKLRDLDLVTNRKPIIMQSEDKTVVEVFGWKSKQAMEEAHSNPAVQEMWKNYSEVCEYIPIGKLKEAADLFSEFTPIDYSD